MSVCVDVCGPCHLTEHWEPCVMESEGHADLALPFTGPETADTAPHWMLQQGSCAQASWESRHLNLGEVVLPFPTGGEKGP